MPLRGLWAFLLALIAPGACARGVAAQSVYRAVGGENVWLVAAVNQVPVWHLIAHSTLSFAELQSLPRGAEISLPHAELQGLPSTAEVARRQRLRAAATPHEEGTAIYLLGLGETLLDVARRFDVRLASLMEINGFKDEDLWKLAFETPIAIPFTGPSEIQQPGTRPPQGKLYTLRGQQTIWDVAGRSQVGLSELMAANGLSEHTLRSLDAGSRLFVPAARFGAPGEAARRSTTLDKARRRASRLGLGKMAAAGPLYHGRVRRRWTREIGPPSLLSGVLRWPVDRGHFVRGYGAGPGQYHLAIDIGADIGAKVRAAAPGIVAYADNGIRGYGNLALIVHPGGLITMYAHNSALHVVAGEEVSAGEVIAEVGSTGLSRGPHVHFELMYKGENCDPTALLRPGIRAADGSIERPESQVEWRPPDTPPPAVQCARRRHYPKDKSQDDPGEP